MPKKNVWDYELLSQEDFPLDELSLHQLYKGFQSTQQNALLQGQRVAESLQRNPQEIEKISDSVKQKTFGFLAKIIDEQALLFTRQKVQNNINGAINKNFSTIDDYKATVGSIPKIVDVVLIYEQTRATLQKIIDDKNYLEALKFINHKGLLNGTGLPATFDWKEDAYIDNVIRLLTVDSVSEKLIAVFKQYIKIQ